MERPLISVICPSYDRPQHVGPLLDSVLAQDFDDWECVITDDHSPSREEVRAIFDEYSRKSNGKIRCYVNDENLGYDGAFRRLIELARGRFVFVMGDDDFVAPGALRAVADAIARYPNLGVILRAFAFFRDTPDNILQVNRYYPAETRFPAGPQAIVACYRRLVGMSGLVLDRDASVALPLVSPSGRAAERDPPRDADLVDLEAPGHGSAVDGCDDRLRKVAGHDAAEGARAGRVGYARRPIAHLIGVRPRFVVFRPAGCT
jgi:glycosyltransferase involved in cell wall biosynthesis